MKNKKTYVLIGVGFLLFLGLILFSSDKKEVDFSERVKVSLREVGNQLLLSNQDTTSLVLPIQKINQFTYKISFQNNFSLEPNDLVVAVKKNFKKLALPNDYRVEVVSCNTNDVFYSYEVKQESEKNIIPCLSRVLPNSCYVINLKFINKSNALFNKSIYLIVALFLLVVLAFFLFKKTTQKESLVSNNEEVTKIGSFHFYPTQNKLIKQTEEISLSKKECELLAIFVSRPNEIIKRDELTKRVWEDQGVFVGRSLDTYISKLRKKLKDDSNIKITNIHGVGYKLEIN